jgi:hypothetical protein
MNLKDRVDRVARALRGKDVPPCGFVPTEKPGLWYWTEEQGEGRTYSRSEAEALAASLHREALFVRFVDPTPIRRGASWDG